MLTKLRSVLLGSALLVVSTSLTILPTGNTQEVQAGEADPEQVVQDFFDNVNDGDVDGAIDLLAGNFVFTTVNEIDGSFAVFGTPAFSNVLEEVVDAQNSTEVQDLDADGDTVTGVGVFSDEDSDDAGVDRYLQPFEITLDDEGLIVTMDFTYDEDDEQTQDYLDFIAERESEGEDGDDELPPGAKTIAMGAQSGTNQTGDALMVDDEGLTFVFIDIAPGADGVLQPAHLHTGTCAAPGPIVQTLASVLNGQSGSLLSPFPMTLANQGLIINVHKSHDEPGVYTSCGVVQEIFVDPTATPPAAAPTAAPSPATPSSGVTPPNTGTGGGNDGGIGVAAIAAVAGLVALAGMAAIGTGVRRRAR